MRRQRQFRFYASSLLFVFEGARDESAPADVRLSMSMIDMAHALSYRDDDDDNGYCVGLANLKRVFRRLLDVDDVASDDDNVDDDTFQATSLSNVER